MKFFKVLVAVWILIGLWAIIEDCNKSKLSQNISEPAFAYQLPDLNYEVTPREVKVEPQDLFDKYFGTLAPEARVVAQCESGMNPNAQNKKTDDRGLMQINYKTWHKVFGDVDYFDPETNISLAKQIYDRSGNWSPWKSSKKCHNLN